MGLQFPGSSRGREQMGETITMLAFQEGEYRLFLTLMVFMEVLPGTGSKWKVSR